MVIDWQDCVYLHKRGRTRRTSAYGTAVDVTIAGLREAFLPADEETAAILTASGRRS